MNHATISTDISNHLGCKEEWIERKIRARYLVLGGRPRSKMPQAKGYEWNERRVEMRKGIGIWYRGIEYSPKPVGIYHYKRCDANWK